MSRDELLSAYLDGALDDAEQAEVERLLVESVECRQLLDELRSQSEALSELPRHRLSPGFAQAVVSEALRRQAAQTSAPLSVPAASADFVEPARRSARKLRFGRGLLWATLAAAAAVLIIVSRPENPRPGEVGKPEFRKSVNPKIRDPQTTVTPPTTTAKRNPPQNQGSGASRNLLATKNYFVSVDLESGTGTDTIGELLSGAGTKWERFRGASVQSLFEDSETKLVEACYAELPRRELNLLLDSLAAHSQVALVSPETVASEEIDRLLRELRSQQPAGKRSTAGAGKLVRVLLVFRKALLATD